MSTITSVLFGGGMDVKTAIRQFGLDNDECYVLAKKECMDWIARKIKDAMDER